MQAGDLAETNGGSVASKKHQRDNNKKIGSIGATASGLTKVPRSHSIE